MKQFQKRIRKMRQKKQLSYQEVEQYTGIPMEKLMNVEAGIEHLTIGEMDRLLAVYKVSYEDVMASRRIWKMLLKWVIVFIPVAVIGIFVLYPCVTKDTTLNDELSSVEGASGPLETWEQEDVSESEDASIPSDFDTISDQVEPSEPVVSSDPLQEQSPVTLQEEETVVFRFWGNIPYDTEQIPHIPDGDVEDSQRVIDIFPVERLSDVRPVWLQDRDPQQLIINAGATDVWTETTVEAYQQLKEDQYQVIGLGTSDEVYEPYVIEVNEKKVGFLPLAGLIHQAEEIALPSRVGLARAYRTDEVTQAVSAAKKKVDYLFVLTHWGKKWMDELNMAQKVIAPAIVEAGGDMIIGNHPYQSQDIVAIDGTPVFYALGHTVFGDTEEFAYIYDDISYNYVLDIVFTNQVDQMKLRVGKMEDKKLQFQLTDEDWKLIKDTIEEKVTLFDNLEIVDGR